MPLQDLVMAGLKFDKEALARIGSDEGESGNALIMIIISVIISAALGAVGSSTLPVGGMFGNEEPNMTMLIIGNLFSSLFMTFVLAWIFAAATRMVGGQSSTMQVIRIMGATQIWSILGNLLLFANLGFATILGLIGLVAFLIGMSAASGKGVGSMIIALIISIIIVMVLLFAIMFVLVLVLLGALAGA